MNCPKCESDRVTVQARTEERIKRRGCFAWCLWILLAICTIGLIIVIPAVTNTKIKRRTITEAICQNCGHRWEPK